MRTVSPGEPILPALTAEWYNHTVKPHPSPPQGRPQPHRHQNEILAKFVPGGGFTEAARFDPVALNGSIDPNYMERACYATKQNMDNFNWVIPQATMRSGQLTQPCVYAGLTYANVTITDINHRYVWLNGLTLQLESGYWGKALLLTQNFDGPSLISISQPATTGWILKTMEPITAGSVSQLGSGLCRIYDVTVVGSLHLTDITITAFNSQPQVIPEGLNVQAKAVNGMPVIDVVPCDDF